MPDHCDIVVVGAGAAGIAAARLLMAYCVDVRLLEARGRPGGRAYTRIEGGFPLDMGCGWLHSAEVNVLKPLARAAGFAIDESDPPWQRVPDPRYFAPEKHAQFRAAHDAFDERLAAAGESLVTGQDHPASALLEDGCIWNPMFSAISTYVNGVELDGLSVRDVTRYRDSEVNHRVAEGLGRFIAAMASGLPVTYDCPVHGIDHAGARITVRTARGDITCARVIVTVPTNVLASGAIRFTPGLPEYLDAAAHLPLGVANKVFLSASGADALLPGTFLIADRMKTATGSYHLRPFGWPMVEGYFGGAYARELERAGPEAFAEQAIAELCAVFGSDWRRRLTPVVSSAWAGAPLSLGSYSHALPGHADKRAVLAAAHENRIFFAGEATAPHFFSTVHGAWESGERAAREAMPMRDMVA